MDVVVSERKKLLWLQHTTWLQIANMLLSTGCSWPHSPSCCLPEWPLSGMCWGEGGKEGGGGERMVCVVLEEEGEDEQSKMSVV